MSDIALSTTTAYTVTCVPDFFIDEYMVDANGEYVKIFLYLLRSISGNLNSFSVSDIANALEHTEKDVRKALHYWEKKGLLELQYDELHELKTIKIISNPAPVLAPVKVSAPVSTPVLEPAPQTSTNDERLREIVFFAERIMKSPLSMDFIDAIISWHDTLGLSWDLVEDIIDKSVDKGCGNKNYMNKVAIAYANDGVSTLAEANFRNTNFLSVTFAVRGAFALKKNTLNTEQVGYVERWIKEYGFSQELIEEACLRTFRKTKDSSFEYADAILKNWLNNNVKTMEDVAILDAKHSENNNYQSGQINLQSKNNTFNSFGQRSNLDFSQIEKIMQES